MTPFDMLFFGLVIAGLLVIAVELLYMRRPRRRASDRRRWSQVKPPDDQR